MGYNSQFLVRKFWGPWTLLLALRIPEALNFPKSLELVNEFSISILLKVGTHANQVAEGISTNSYS